MGYVGNTLVCKHHPGQKLSSCYLLPIALPSHLVKSTTTVPRWLVLSVFQSLYKWNHGLFFRLWPFSLSSVFVRLIHIVAYSWVYFCYYSVSLIWIHFCFVCFQFLLTAPNAAGSVIIMHFCLVHNLGMKLLGLRACVY